MKPTFNSVDIKPEPMDRSSPGPLKMARKATASVKSEINGYGSPQNATDESESLGLREGAGAGKRKPRATAAATKDKRANAAATVSATPASSTGGSSSEGEASESENDVNNGGGGRTKKGGAVAALKESCGKSGAGGAGRGSLAGRQRNSDSSSSSKEGQPVRKGRAGGGVSGSTGAAVAPGNSSPSGPNAKPGSGNPFNKPPVPVLKKSGESFLQVSRIHPSIRLDMITIVISRISFRVHRMLPVGKSRPVWPSAANAVSLLINGAGTNSKAMPTSFAASTLSGGYDTPSRASWPSLAFPIR